MVLVVFAHNGNEHQLDVVVIGNRAHMATTQGRRRHLQEQPEAWQGVVLLPAPMAEDVPRGNMEEVRRWWSGCDGKGA